MGIDWWEGGSPSFPAINGSVRSNARLRGSGASRRGDRRGGEGIAVCAATGWCLYGVVRRSAGSLFRRRPSRAVRRHRGRSGRRREQRLAGGVRRSAAAPTCSRIPVGSSGRPRATRRSSSGAFARHHGSALCFGTLYGARGRCEEFLEQPAETRSRQLSGQLDGKVEMGVKAFADREAQTAGGAKAAEQIRELSSRRRQAEGGRAYLRRAVSTGCSPTRHELLTGVCRRRSAAARGSPPRAANS